MSARVTASQVWTEIEKQLFGVVGLVTARGEARTIGIVYLVRDGKLYFCTDANAWKTKHLRNNPNLSMTIPIAKRVPFMPWIKIPAATITFAGTGRVLGPAEVPAEIPATLLKGLKLPDEFRQEMAVAEVTPRGDFLTYGVGVSLKGMLNPVEAAGRVSVR